MKLISIHIDNFGKFHDFDLQFDSSLTSICQENGTGKTTIAAFITSMLFGLGKNTKDQRERERYYPFSGGAYGGKLIFSHEGEEYLVRRKFHKTSKAKDEVRITKDKVPYKPGEDKEIGEEVLGIDESAFRRVCFIDDNGLDFSQESIASKLGGLAGDFDAVMVEETLDKILSAIKEIKPLRGNGGSLGEAEENLSRIENEIGRLSAMKPDLEKCQKEYHDALASISNIRNDISTIQNYEINNQRRQNADSLLVSYNQRKKEYEDFKNNFPNGVPLEEEIESIQNSLIEESSLTNPNKTLSEDEEKQYETLSKRFGESLPSQEIISDINATIGEYESINSGISNRKKGSEAEEEIFSRYAENPPTKENINAARAKLKEYKDVSAEYEATDSTISKGVTKVMKQKKKSPLSIALVVFGAALVIGGAVACIFLLVLGIILIILGIVGFIAGIVMLKIAPINNEVLEEERIINPKKSSLGERKDTLRKEIATWLRQYYINNPDPVSGMAIFESEYAIYTSRLEGDKKEEETLYLTKQRANEAKQKIVHFFQAYRYEGEDYRFLLLELQKDAATYSSLKLRKGDEKESEAKRNSALKAAREKIDSFCQKYKVERPNLNQWLKEASKAEQELSHLQKEMNSAEEIYRNYVKANPVLDSETPEFTLEELQEKEAEANRYAAEKRTAIDSYENELDALDGLLYEEEQLKEKIAYLKHRHKLLIATRKNIDLAQNTIKEKYVGPIKKEFERYSLLIQKTSGLKIDLDPKLQLQYFAEGEYRKSLHLSDGERMLVSFCLRLALLGNMFKSDEILVVLDDPFVSLDEGNCKKVLSTLPDLDKSIQILYFTCHPSRTLN